MRVLNPASPLSLDVARFFNGMVILSCVITGLVAFLIVYALIRYRARTPNQEAAHQLHGHRNLEILWTAIPLLIVAVIFVFTVRIMYSTQPGHRRESPDILIAGRQWWWRVQYPNGAITANEVHIPTGRRLNVWLENADVIHDFWVPELAPKIDVVPGRRTGLWLEADRPGPYLGACSEYCGLQHAWMLTRVIAQTPGDFDAWAAAQAQPASTPPPGSEAARGAQLFQEQTCVNCHAIRGTAAAGRVGPDLTHFGSRETIGTGVMTNTLQNLADWIENPQRIKLGVLMPSLKLTSGDAHAIAVYLESLR